ncbi:hypothetical protein GE09DRAFT_1207626 [Coniochaeta sp. 2T2.1]|nr:hypothetical protein GE09DRAFT_1207626 [Coniochaeta sp. 2T2.1]
MVNRGRSGGCVTCKQLRVKCDEAKPECRRCQSLGVRCEGYNKKPVQLRFRDQTPVFCAVAACERNAGAHVRGVKHLRSQIRRSLWRHHTDSFRSPRRSYARAVSCLRRTMQDRTERRKPATVFAVLTLQLYENMAAVYSLRAATCIHQNGAASLLPFADMGYNIAAAMRQKRPLRAAAYFWIGSKDLTVAPDNPSSVLDTIGVCVAELQARYVRLSTPDDFPQPSHRTLRELRAEAKRIDEQLLAWAQSVPHHWNPPRLESGRDIDSSIPTYRSICEVCPSCPIANFWNLWRFQRFLLVKITLGSLNTILSQGPLGSAEDRIFSSEIEELINCKQTIQEIVDSVCYSVPFYLGNRTKPASITDFTDPEIQLPSYHPLPSDDAGGLGDQVPDFKTYCDEYRRHVIAQGPWHAMSPLSRLLTLLSEDRYGQLIARFLRPGQHEWIREQFLRVTTLLRLPSAKPNDYKEKTDCPVSQTPS